jgi:succinate dehydrogenase/fumarate reductase flavoprotein subunit
MDLRCMLVCAEAIARAALARTESRGAHSRLDFPQTSDEWGRQSIVVRLGEGEMVLETQPVVRVEALEQLVDGRRAPA